MAIVVAVGASGCVSGVSDPGGQESQVSPQATETVLEPSVAESELPPSADETTLEPPVVDGDVSLSPVEAGGTMSREAWLTGHWRGKGNPPSPLPVVRVVDQQEFMPTWLGCMEESGWVNTSGLPDEGEFEVPREQSQAYEEANFQCLAQFPLEPRFYQPYNDEQLKFQYAYATGEQTRCLTAEGYPPEGEPPSLEKYIADYRANSPTWSPLNWIADHDYQRVIEICPPFVDEFYNLATVPGE
ncbi:MAG: hypothetical protein Q4G35_02330 [Propionibacteriaceae bacterium]|nr:hypothetical protein [Propionibacteriaceae bacterium]